MIWIVSLISLAACSQGILKNILREKYKEQLSASMRVIRRTNQIGEIEEIIVPPRLYMEKRIFNDPTVIAVLDKFETKPEGVYSDPRLKCYLVDRPVKEYHEDDMSRRIINYCLEVSPDPDYIKRLLCAAVRYNVPDLIYRLVNMFQVSLIEEFDDWNLREYSFTYAVVRSGYYGIVKELISDGYVVDMPVVWIEKICTIHELSHVEAVKDFLNFLIVEREMIQFNDFIIGQPALHLLLNIKPQSESGSEYQQLIAKHLISIGADPRIADDYGMTALQHAAENDISLDFFLH